MWKNTRVTQLLKLQVPIIQGPFGSGHSSIELLSTVSNRGGLGSFGAHYMTADQIGELATEIRTRTSKPFALNLWVSDQDGNGLHLTQAEFEKTLALFRPYYRELGLPDPQPPAIYGARFDDQIEAIFKARPPVFSFVFGIPSREILKECRKLGIVTAGAAVTLDEALALDEAQVDLIVASGFEAGGHRVSFLAPPEDSLVGTFSLIPQVVDRVKAPVIAAGGIADARGIAAARMLGAEGFQIGTAFLACEESNAHPVHRQVLFSPAAQHTALTRAFTGRLARGVRNRFIDEMEDRAKEFAPYPAQGWFSAQLRKAAIEKGRTDLISLWSGQSATLLKHHRAGEFFDSLVRDTDVLFRGT